MRVEPARPARGPLRASRATSRSRTARSCSARSRTARPSCAASAARATPRRRSPRCARSASQVDERRRRRSTRPRRRPARPRSARGPIDCGNAGTLDAAARRACSPARTGRFALIGDESLSPRPMERVAEPLRADGRADRDDRRPPAADDRRGAPLDGDRLRAAGRERAGEVRDPARGARRARADDRASSRRRPATTPSGCCRRRRARDRRRPGEVAVARRPSACCPRSTSPATSRRPRRSSSRRRCSPSRG